MKRVGILTGLATEAHIIRDATSDSTSPPLIASAGADAARARREAERLVANGAEALLSFGLAGGLDPPLAPGTIILASAVRLPGGGSATADAAWLASLHRQAVSSGISLVEGPVVGSATIVATAEQKAALAARTGALAVDMESHALAEAASAAGLPFAVVRAVADPAAQSLPRAVQGAVGADGAIRPLPVVARLLWSPWQLPEVVRLHLNARAALAALRRLARILGPALSNIR